MIDFIPAQATPRIAAMLAAHSIQARFRQDGRQGSVRGREEDIA